MERIISRMEGVGMLAIERTAKYEEERGQTYLLLQVPKEGKRNPPTGLCIRYGHIDHSVLGNIVEQPLFESVRKLARFGRDAREDSLCSGKEAIVGRIVGLGQDVGFFCYQCQDDHR